MNTVTYFLTTRTDLNCSTQGFAIFGLLRASWIGLRVTLVGLVSGFVLLKIWGLGKNECVERRGSFLFKKRYNLLLLFLNSIEDHVFCWLYVPIEYKNVFFFILIKKNLLNKGRLSFPKWKSLHLAFCFII